MQVGAGNSAAAAAETQAVSPGDLLTFLHVRPGQVGITGHITETMVNLDMIAIAAALVLDRDDGTVAGSIDRIAGRTGEIHTGMALANTQNRVGAVAEGAGKPIGGRIRVHGRDGRNVRRKVTGRLLQRRHIVKGFGLDIGPLLQHIQSADDIEQSRPFQCGIAVFAAETGLAGRRRDVVQAIDRAVDAVVPDFEQGQKFLVAVQLLGHLIHPGAPTGILQLQNGGFGQILPQYGHIEPHVKQEKRRAGQKHQQERPATKKASWDISLRLGHILQR